MKLLFCVVLLFVAISALKIKPVEKQKKIIKAIPLALAFTSAAKEAVKESKRQKRDLEEDSECFEECMEDVDELEEEMEEEQEDEGTEHGLLESEISDPSYLKEYCSTYNKSKTCADKCKTKATEEQLAEYKGHEFVCTQNYEKFLGKIECFKKIRVKLTKECGEPCGGADLINQQEQVIEETDEVKPAMDNICGYFQCVAKCAKPMLDNECGSGSGYLVAEFNRIELKAAEVELDSYALGHMFPDRCRQVANPDKQYPNVKAWDPKNPTPVPVIDPAPVSDVEMMMMLYETVLEKQMEVLEKEETKLKMEIELLKANKV